MSNQCIRENFWSLQVIRVAMTRVGSHAKFAFVLSGTNDDIAEILRIAHNGLLIPVIARDVLHVKTYRCADHCRLRDHANGFRGGGAGDGPLVGSSDEMHSSATWLSQVSSAVSDAPVRSMWGGDRPVSAARIAAATSANNSK